jgi:hypothetical protein
VEARAEAALSPRDEDDFEELPLPQDVEPRVLRLVFERTPRPAPDGRKLAVHAALAYYRTQARARILLKLEEVAFALDDCLAFEHLAEFFAHRVSDVVRRVAEGLADEIVLSHTL